MRIVDVQAPHRLVWEGGSLDAILGRHSFVLTPQPDGTTEFTDSEEYFGAGAAELVPALGQLKKDYARYGAALRARVEFIRMSYQTESPRMDASLPPSTKITCPHR